MGTLSLSKDQSATAPVVPESGVIQTADGNVERLHGKKLETDLHIVLENITHGFSKPNVLDLKLGAQLWDEGAKPEKRARLEKVAAETTSSSLGFRIAGMRTFKGDNAAPVDSSLKEYVEDKPGEYVVYNKMYGRKFSEKDIEEGFWAYILPSGQAKASKEEKERAREILSYFLGEVRDVIKAFESKESRMYSASILLVYEGDLEEYAKTKKLLSEGDGQEEEAEDDDEDPPKLAAVKMIDFAHATWHPGQGPDENALRGMRSTVKILEDLLGKVEKDLEERGHR